MGPCLLQAETLQSPYKYSHNPTVVQKNNYFGFPLRGVFEVAKSHSLKEAL